MVIWMMLNITSNMMCVSVLRELDAETSILSYACISLFRSLVPYISCIRCTVNATGTHLKSSNLVCIYGILMHTLLPKKCRASRECVLCFLGDQSIVRKNNLPFLQHT